MSRCLVALAATLALVLAGCSGDSARAPDGAKPTPGSYSEGGGLSKYYAEELHEKRIYIFGTKAAHEKFMASKDMNPLASKTMVGEGPNRETIVVQAEKDQPAMTDRIVGTFKKRYGLN